MAIYAQMPGVDTYYWLTSYDFYTRAYTGSTRKWDISGSITTSATVFGTAFVLSQQWFNYNRESPSAFQQCVPIASAIEYVNQRLFVGAIKEATGEYAYSDYYYSWDRNPFRFQQVQEDEFRGGYGQVAGERVMAFRLSASAALGAGRVFMFTDQWLYSMGESGPFSDAGLPTSEIGRPVRIGPHGTLSPRSPAVGLNAMMWVDQDSQVMRLSNGGLANLSKSKVSDKLNASVASRKSYITGAFWRDRFYFGYTPSGGTVNTRVLVWNDEMSAWESEDQPAGSADFDSFHVWPTTPGVIYATRLFLYDATGALFAYEETTSGTVDIDFTTGEYQFEGWESWFIQECGCMATMNTGVSLTINRIGRTWGTDEPWVTTLSLEKSGADVARAKDNYTPTKTGTARGPQDDIGWQLKVTGTVAPRTKFLRFQFRGCGVTADAFGR